MSKTASPKKTQPTRSAAPPAEDSASAFRWIREGIETLAIALILAFLFKTYVAEAYVIPTGSMGPTLMGRHKDIDCPECGFRYQVGASEEADEGNGGKTTERRLAARRGEPTPPPPEVVGGTCPQCRYTAYLGKDNDEKKVYLSYEGDRILVFKYLFDFWEPTRWDATVFRWPGGPQTNFIKRLVGLENETVRIQNGDIFIRPKGEERFKISRKPANHLFAMLQAVNDNDYFNPRIHQTGWPVSWADETAAFGKMPTVPSDLALAWGTEDHRLFSSNGSIPEMRWLHYRHIVPGSDDWLYLAQGEFPKYGVTNNPQLITDFYSYNSGIVRDPPAGYGSANAGLYVTRQTVPAGDSTRISTVCRANPESVGFNWDGDLLIECRLEVLNPKGKAALRLVKGGVSFLCEIDLVSGAATISIPGYEKTFPPQTAPTILNRAGTYRLQFANVDEQMRFWVDGKEIVFEGSGEYDHLCEGRDALLKRNRSPNALDLTPASIGAAGAEIRVDHLKVLRDLYYIAADKTMVMYDGSCDLIHSPFYFGVNSNAEEKNAGILSNPDVWELFGKTRSVEFPLEKDQFFMLGDNSPKSMDARSWNSMPGGGQYVSRDYLIGQAAVVYWPHGLRIPLVNLPYFPNVRDMRFID